MRMSIPLPPGNYWVMQGIPAYIKIMAEGYTSHADEEIDCIYHSEGEVGARCRGDNFDRGPMRDRFKLLPPELQEVITARFTELFALDIGTAGKSPRGDRADHYKLHPVFVTVNPK